MQNGNVCLQIAVQVTTYISATQQTVSNITNRKHMQFELSDEPFHRS